MTANKKIMLVTAITAVCLLVIFLVSFMYQGKEDKNPVSGENKARIQEILEKSAGYLCLPSNSGIEGDGNHDSLITAFRKNRVLAQQLYQKDHLSDEETEQIISTLNDAMMSIDTVVMKLDSPKADNSGIIDTAYINDAKCAYDKASETFYFPIDMSRTEPVLLYISSVSGAESYIFAEILDENGNTLSLDFVPETKTTYKISVISPEYSHEYSLIFTGMPVVQISDIKRIEHSYTDCSFSLTSPLVYGTQTEEKLFDYTESTAKIHIRGSSARGWPKSSYAVKLVDSDDLNKDVSLLGMRENSDWILDAMYVDMSRARNRVTTDLWNSFSQPVYYQNQVTKTVSNGTHGEFVELFINNEYAGLYCFTEKIDRAQLQVKKYDETTNTIHGLIYKGKGWDSPLKFKSYYNFSNNENWWASFQQKYPNPNRGYPIDWEPLYNFIKFVVDSDDDTFRKEIGSYLDIDNYVDYTIMLCFAYASDNTGKNAYWSVYDIQDEELSKFFLTIWDVKSTWGRSWNPSKTSPNSEWMDSGAEHDSAIFRRLVLTNADGFADKLVERWNEVKQDKFSPAAVKKLFNEYFDLFDQSGAWEREAAKWNKSMMQYCGQKLDLESEREYIMGWIDARYEYIDEFINTKLDTVGKFGTKW